MDSSIKTDVRTGIFTKVRRIRQSRCRQKAPAAYRTCKRYASIGGHFTYDDRQADLFTEMQASSYALTVHWQGGANTLDLEMGCSSLLFSNPTYTLKNDLSLRLKSRLVLAEHYNSITLKDAELKVNNLPFTADGAIRHFPENRHTRIDMDMGLKISDMNDLLKFIPDAYFQNRDKIQAEVQSL